MNNETEYSQWITYKEAADRLKCSKKTIQRLVRDGALTAHRRPGHPNRLIPVQEIVKLEQPKPVGDEQ